MDDVNLPSRYEIRPLELEHLEWAKALFAHSTVFGSPLWRNLYPDNKTARFHGLYQASHYLLRHQIASGLSLGVFDTEHVPRDPRPAPSDSDADNDDNDDDDEEGSKLLQQFLDTPLVSIACAHDAFHAVDPRFVAPVMARLPGCALFDDALTTSTSTSTTVEEMTMTMMKATAPGQVLRRMGTATRADAAGRGLMGRLARRMMRAAADAGFRGVWIDCAHDAVAAVWERPPPPFAARLVAEVDDAAAAVVVVCPRREGEGKGEVDGRGGPRFPVRQRLARVYVALA